MKSTNFARDLKNWFSVGCVSEQDHKCAKLQGHPHSVSRKNLDTKKKKKKNGTRGIVAGGDLITKF